MSAEEAEYVCERCGLKFLRINAPHADPNQCITALRWRVDMQAQELEGLRTQVRAHVRIREDMQALRERIARARKVLAGEVQP